MFFGSFWGTNIGQNRVHFRILRDAPKSSRIPRLLPYGKPKTPSSSQDIGELKSKNVRLDGGPIQRGDGESVYFNDPDGNHLEIHYDNP